jgi:hypothetical protein
MRKKLIGGLAVAAALCMAAPAWAGGGHERGHGNGHAYGHARHWQHQPVQRHYVHRHYVREHYVVREVVRPVPVYPRAIYPAPAPGIHVVFPGLFFPF